MFPNILKNMILENKPKRLEAKRIGKKRNITDLYLTGINYFTE